MGPDGRPLRGKLKKRIAFEDVSSIGAVTMLNLEKDYLIVDMGAVVPKLGEKFASEPRLGPITRSAREQSRIVLESRLKAEGFELMDVASARNDSFPDFLLFGRGWSPGREDTEEAGAGETMTASGDTAHFSAALNDGARLGYRLRAASLQLQWVPGFLGNGEKAELKAVLVRTTSSSRAEYRVLATVRATTLQEEIDKEVASGFIPVAITWKSLERVAVLERIAPVHPSR